MPVYEVQDEKGQSLTLEGDSPPSEAELEQLFAREFPVLPRVDIPAPGTRQLGRLEPAPSALTAGQVPTTAERARELPEMSLEEGVDLAMQPQVALPRVTKEGTALRGIENLVAMPLESATAPATPYILAAQLVPVVREIVDSVLGASVVKAGAGELGEASVTRNKEKLITGAGLVGMGALGMLAPLRETVAMELESRKVGPVNERAIDLAVLEALRLRDKSAQLIPETQRALREPIPEPVRPNLGEEVPLEDKPAPVAPEQATRPELPAEPAASRAAESEVAASEAPAIRTTTPIVEKPQTREPNATKEISQQEILRQEPQGGIEGGKAQEASVSDSIQRPAESQAETPVTLVETDVAGGSAGTTPMTPAPAAPASVPVKGLHEIQADLAKGLGIPIRFGRLTTPRFGGYFKRVQNLIGSKRAVDMPVVSHEVGHKLDSLVGLSSDAALAPELDRLGDPATPGSRSSWTKSKPKSYKMGEGVAEFVRYWMIEPAKARAEAPNTFAKFEAALNANPDFGDVMRKAQGDIQVWRSAPNEARLMSHISVGENPNGTPYRLTQLTRDLVDDLHVLRLVMDDAAKFSGKEALPSENIYLLARNLRGAYGWAETFIRRGVVDFRTRKVALGTSLEDALKPVAGHIDEFRRWIIAKRAQELHAQGRETGLLQVDVDAVVNKYNRVPEFHAAFDAVKTWQNSLLQYLEDSGFISPEARAAMNEMNRDYVPMHRLFEIGAGEAPSQSSSGLGRGLNVGTPSSLKRLRGSPRPIVDPLETMVKNAYTLTVAAEKGYIHAQLAKLASAPGMGKWVEEIRTPKEQVQVPLEKIRAELEAAGADLTGVPDDLLLTMWRTSNRVPFGENIIRVGRGADAKLYRLKSELFETFHALDMEDGGAIIRILSAPANLLRAGVTLDPAFAGANAIRDAFGSVIVGKYTSYPFQSLLKGITALTADPKVVAEWAASGGKHSIEASFFDRKNLQAYLRERITKDLSPAERALVVVKSPLRALRALSAAAEEATRIGEYQLAFDALRKQGMPEGEARRLAAFESRDRQDFAKGGAKTKAIRMLAAFWNAGLQANVKLAQAFRERPVQTFFKGFAFITIPKLLEQAVNSDDPDYWDRPRWERDLFFLFPIGKDANNRTRFLRIPTPFEPGIIFGTLTGRVFEAWRNKDPEAFQGFAYRLLESTIPNPTPNTGLVVVENFLTGKQGWDIFRGRPVVPDSLADGPVDMQFTQQTSLTAKKLGKLVGLSPLKVDHIIAQMTGGLGRQVVHQGIDRAISAATGEERTAQGTVPGGRFITSPAGILSQSVEDFYENLAKIQAEEQRAKLTGKGAPWASLGRKFRQAQGQMADLRKTAGQAKTPEEQQKYRIQIADIARQLNEAAKAAGVK